MIEQVWKNVFGDAFEYRIVNSEVVLTIPRGIEMRLYEFVDKLRSIENALGQEVKIYGIVMPDGLLQIRISFGEQGESEDGVNTRAES